MGNRRNEKFNRWWQLQQHNAAATDKRDGLPPGTTWARMKETAK